MSFAILRSLCSVGSIRCRTAVRNAKSPMMTPRRFAAPTASPPQYPMATGEKLLLGGGFCLVIMIIPLWGVLSLGKWAQDRDRKLAEAEAETSDETSE